MSSEKYSGIVLDRREVDEATMDVSMSGRRFHRLGDLDKVPKADLGAPGRTGGARVEWLTIGVLCEKSMTKTSASGAKFCSWTLTDLKGMSPSFISVLLFGEAHSAYWSESIGSVWVVFNPDCLPGRDKAKKDQVTLSVKHGFQLTRLGRAAHLGTCKGKRRDGKPCTMIVNTSSVPFCQFHVGTEYKRMRSSRPDLQTMSGELLPGRKPRHLSKSGDPMGNDAKLARRDRAADAASSQRLMERNRLEVTERFQEASGKGAGVLSRGLMMAAATIGLDTNNIKSDVSARLKQTERLKALLAGKTLAPGSGRAGAAKVVMREGHRASGAAAAGGTPGQSRGNAAGGTQSRSLGGIGDLLDAAKGGTPGESRTKPGTISIGKPSSLRRLADKTAHPKRARAECASAHGSVAAVAGRAPVTAAVSKRHKSSGPVVGALAGRSAPEPHSGGQRAGSGAGVATSPSEPTPQLRTAGVASLRTKNGVPGRANVVSRPLSAPSAPVTAKNFLARISIPTDSIEAKMVRSMTSINAELADAAREEVARERFRRLEEEEKMEEAVKQVHSLQVSVYVCAVCKTRSEKRNALCAEANHRVKRVVKHKYFWQCKCGNKETVLGHDRRPFKKCERCGSSSWEASTPYGIKKFKG